MFYPSIDWSPNPLRIQALIEEIQLRAPTVMFIDDNSSNLAEVRSLCRVIQVQNVDFRCVDIKQRAVQRQAGSGDDFYLSSVNRSRNARKIVRITQPPICANFFATATYAFISIFEVLGNLDRAIELINRTNQLNFTKKVPSGRSGEGQGLSFEKELGVF